jgi:hypothetical protein
MGEHTTGYLRGQSILWTSTCKSRWAIGKIFGVGGVTEVMGVAGGRGPLKYFGEAGGSRKCFERGVSVLGERETNGGNWSLLGRDEGEGVLRHPEAPRRVPRNYKVGRKFSYPWNFYAHRSRQLDPSPLDQPQQRTFATLILMHDLQLFGITEWFTAGYMQATCRRTHIAPSHTHTMYKKEETPAHFGAGVL